MSVRSRLQSNQNPARKADLRPGSTMPFSGTLARSSYFRCATGEFSKMSFAAQRCSSWPLAER